ncbi:MAG TPA: hypothetical protein VHR86_08790 [Armatimonadota bacterium]|nr:hypothetical protein [Armatimonadota bacterium]
MLNSETQAVTSNDRSCQKAMDAFRRRLRQLVITALGKGAHASCVEEALVITADLVSESWGEAYAFQHNKFFVMSDESSVQ